MKINSTHSASINDFYPNPTSKETLNFIKGVTQEYNDQSLQFTQEKLQQTVESLTKQRERRTSAVDYQYVNPSQIIENSGDKKIGAIRNRLASIETSSSSPNLTNRVKVKQQ